MNPFKLIDEANEQTRNKSKIYDINTNKKYELALMELLKDRAATLNEYDLNLGINKYKIMVWNN